MRKRQTRRFKREFLERFAEYGNVSRACREVGIPYRTIVYEWERTDGEFARLFAEADTVATERLEEEAWRRAVDGVEKPVYQGGRMVGAVTEYSDTVLMRLLAARKPEVYREHYDVNLQGRIQHAPLAGLLSEPVTIDATAREVTDDD